ncbi:MAG: hypothetical protein NWF07_07435 [Candidatus Bathyarchaeota archaeon]|nr:hypothetical protein [Candidatus Bathyarchaeota archaeon]
MHKHPYIHASAIEAGFKSEKVSHMIEALLEHRTQSLKPVDYKFDLEHAKKLKYAFV